MAILLHGTEALQAIGMRHHGQLSLSCVPEMSCDHFNQPRLAKGKIAPAVLFANEAK